MITTLNVFAGSDVGLVRRSNEDAFVVADLSGGDVLQGRLSARFEVGERGVLLAVSDGMGGHAAGEVASALVVESLQRSMAVDPPRNARTSDALMEAATKKANRDVWEAARQPGRKGMGATLTAVFIRGSTAHIAEVGDSRAYLLRGGMIEQITRDQSYVQLLIDQGISPRLARQSPLSSVILQAMGHARDVRVALGRLALRRRDCLILCSDGLSNKLSAGEIRSTVLEGVTPDAAGARLIELAKQRGGEDNITVIVAGVGGDLQELVEGETLADTFEVLKEFRPARQGSETSRGAPR